MVRAIFLSILVAIISLLAYTITARFLEALFLGAVLAVITYPYYERLQAWSQFRKGVASGLMCLAVTLVIVLPVFGIVSAVSAKAIFYIDRLMTAGTTEYVALQDLIRTVAAWIPDGNKYVEHVDLLVSKFGVMNLAHFGAAFFRAAYSGLVEIALGSFVVTVTLFYAYVDGPTLLANVKRISPLRDEHEEQLFSEFASMARAMVKGTLLIGTGQGIASGVVLYFTGIEGAWLWTMFMIVLGIIPVAGANLIMWPIAVIEFATGHIGAGIIIVLATVIIGVADHLVRPKVIGKDAQMHSGLILLSLTGGVLVWGPIGFLEGPIVWALCLAVWNLFELEFRDSVRGEKAFRLPRKRQWMYMREYGRGRLRSTDA